MKVALLCGGIGKRMFPLTEDKFLMKFVGKTLIEHQIERAKQAGLDEFVIIANPNNIERVTQVTGKIPGVKVKFAVQKEPLGIADALKSAEHLLDGEVVVVNPNDVFESSAYLKLVTGYKTNSSRSYVVVMGYAVDDYFPGGYLVIDAENHLKHIVEKPGKGQEPSELVNILVHLHTDFKRFLEYAGKVETSRDDAYERALDDMIREQRKIVVVIYSDFWQAIKYPWHLFRVVQHFLETSDHHISPSARISDKATIEGKVIIGDNVRVLENAIIRGPAYIGPNTVIGNNVLVRSSSHIGADCVVGYGTEVKGSYIGDRCWFHSSYIGDSIISDDCSFASGTVLANLRLDEKNVKIRFDGETIDTGQDKLGAIIGRNCKTGINTSIMPGVRIGEGSFVGPHVCLMKDLEPGKMILAEPNYHIAPNNIAVDEEKKEQFSRRLLGEKPCVE